MQHVGARLLAWAAEGLSALTAFVVVVHPQAGTAPAIGTDDALSWLIRGLLGISLALNTYFLKKLSDNVTACGDTAKDLTVRVAVLERSYDLWMEVERQERGEIVERRERTPGRRAEDMALALLKKQKKSGDRDD